MRSPGLRTRTTLLVLLAVTAVWVVAVVLAERAARDEAAEVFDAHLEQAAALLLAQTAVRIEDEDDLESVHASVSRRFAHKVVFQVWDDEGELLVHSAHAPNVRLARGKDGFSSVRIDGEHWRVYSAWNRGRERLVQVGERIEAREDMASALVESLLEPLLWALPLLAVVLWIVIGRAIEPLRVLSREIAQRSPERLEPLDGVAVPREVEPLVRRLDSLLARVGEALRSEKRFTGDAAHELRTPIAALCAQAEVALAATADDERQKALGAVLQAAQRMAHLVEQLLTLARADSAMPQQWPAIDLAALAREVVGELAQQAVERHVELDLDSPERLGVRGEGGWLRILLRNLLENALRHAPAGSVVDVTLTPVGEAAVLLGIGDAGPGVSVEQREFLGERFWRGGSSAAGSGLGLSIARRIAELHGSLLEYGSGADGRGLRVTLRLPRASL